MVSIRLKRLGAKRRPVYRIVVADGRTRRNGSTLAQIGFYNPRANVIKGETALTLDVEAARLWLERGAQPTETVLALMRRAQVFAVQPVGT
ncbi:30S ribosomal protein S16 [Candidatus Cyanaurora vandensis]|uniref:30S ribosomal protein S16 n=1 Tax=Candidatus Cyanaurora vandensis TaxID=2714958 RepID=UPI0037C0A849